MVSVLHSSHVILSSKNISSLYIFSENKTSQSKSDEERVKDEMDCAEDETYLAKLSKERKWDDWKDGVYV
jgi:hypothetical protein